MAYVVQLGTYTPLTDSWALLLDLNDGQNLELDDPNGIEIPAPSLETFVATNPRIHGARVMHTTYGERTITAHCMAGPATSYAAMQLTLQALTGAQEATRVARQAGVLGLGAAPRVALKIQPPGSVTPLFADVLALSHDLPSVGDAEAWVRLLQEGVMVEMVCAPFLRGGRVTLANDVPNPGFEHWGWVNGGGLGSVVFDDSLANFNAYSVVAGAAPTQYQTTGNTYAQQVVADVPTAWYRFAEASGSSAADSSGNGHTATISGSGIAYGQPGLIFGDANTAFGFNGVAGLVTPPGTVFAGPVSGFTLEAWVKDLGNGANNGGLVSGLSYGAPNYYADIELNDGAIRFECNNGNSNTGSVAHSFLNAITHVVMTYSGATGVTTGYINGVSVWTGATGPGNFTLNQWKIGDWDAFMDGVIDEVAIYNYALNGAQVATHYSIGSSGPIVTSYPNTMSIPAGTTVQFGSPIWDSVANYQARFLYASGVSASFVLHFQDAYDQVYAIVNGSGLVLYQLVGGVSHTLLSLACVLTSGVNYWFSATLFPSAGNYAPTFQCGVFNDAGGARGTTVVGAGQAVLVSASAGVSGPMRISAITGNLVLAGNGFPYVHLVALFGPGGWRCLNVGTTTTAFPSGAWDAVNTFGGGPAGSGRCARMDLPPAGTIYADWSHYFLGDSSSFAVNEVANQVFHASVWVRSSGLSATGQVTLVATEYSYSGAAIIANTASLTGNVGAWTQIALSWTAAGAGTLVGISCRVNEPTAGASAGATIWFDNVQCWADALGATMPFCDLRHSASPALLLVSGLLGDVPAPILLAIGTQPPSGNLATGASISVFAGRRSQSTWLPSLVGPSLATAPDGSSSFSVLDPLAYAGFHSAFRGASSFYAALALTGTVANQAGVYHQLLRARTQEAVPGNALLQVDCYEVLSAWLGLASYQDRLSVYQTPQVNPWTAGNVWTLADGGQVSMPLSPLSPSTDPSLIYATTLAQSTNSVVGMDVDWVGLVPTDTEILAAQFVNSSLTAALNGWIWQYFDGQLQDVSGMSSATWSLEPYAAPNVAHAGGAPGTSAGPAPGINLAGDASLSIDPQLSTVNGGVVNLGVNQLVIANMDSNGDVMPVMARVTYTPRYLYVR